jgi:5-methylcytosine-specific restriction protein B
MILKSKEQEFQLLFVEFVEQYLKAKKGQQHLMAYAEYRTTGRKNFDAIRSAANAGENVTDSVLQKLLPHSDSAAHRTSGAWIHITPAIMGTSRCFSKRPVGRNPRIGQK